MLKEMRLPSKENWEKKKKKPLVACTGTETERGSGQQTRAMSRDACRVLESVVVTFKRTDLRKRVLQFLVELEICRNSLGRTTTRTTRNSTRTTRTTR